MQDKDIILRRSIENFYRSNSPEVLKEILTMLIYRDEILLARRMLEIFIRRGGRIYADKDLVQNALIIYSLFLDIHKVEEIINSTQVDPHIFVKTILELYGDVMRAERFINDNRDALTPYFYRYAYIKIARLKAKPINVSNNYGNPDAADRLSILHEIVMHKLFSGKIGVLSRFDSLIDLLGKHRLFKISSLLQLYKALIHQNISYLHLVEKTSEDVGDNYTWVLTKIFQSFILGRDLLEEENYRLNPKLGILYTNYRIVKRYIDGTPFKTPEELKGFEHFWWLMDKIRNNKEWINFSGKLALYRGITKINPPKRNRKYLVGYAFVKVFKSIEALENHQHVIFPKSKNRRKLLWDLKSRTLSLLKIPNNMEIALDYGCFLDEEDSEWADILRKNV